MENCRQKIGIFFEILRILLPKIGRRQNQTIVFGKNGILRVRFYIFNVQTYVADVGFAVMR